MNNVTDIDSARVHITNAIKCRRCDHEWIAVYPEGTDALECPGCHNAVNEYGTAVSMNICKACGCKFTLCPPNPIENECLAEECSSYDPNRDVDKFFDKIRRDDD